MRLPPFNNWPEHYDILKELEQYGYKFDVFRDFKPKHQASEYTVMTGQPFHEWISQRFAIQSVFPFLNLKIDSMEHPVYTVRLPKLSSNTSTDRVVFVSYTRYRVQDVVNEIKNNELHKQYYDVHHRIGDTSLGGALDL